MIIEYLKKKKRQAYENIININGWKTDRKLVVMESDDWGSIRIPSRIVYDDLLKSGDRVDQDPFTRYDALESEKDISELAEVLKKFKDCQGNNPVMTTNFAVANPDFDKIKENGFQSYYYEPFIRTYERYPEHKQAFSLIKDCVEQNIFCPQLHCREHLNVNRWMKDLRAGKSDVKQAFDHRMISIWKSFAKDNPYAYMDSFNYHTEKELSGLKDILFEGANLFNNIFGYPSQSFIASCYIWGREIEDAAAELGIDYIQGDRYQLIPQKGGRDADLRRKSHYIGEKNRNAQIYLMRNCTFEPSWDQRIDWVDRCLSQISTAFKWQKPATISTHRLNYIGYIDVKNREKNLKLLELLFTKITQIWPDMEYLSSAELGRMIRGGYGEEEI